MKSEKPYWSYRKVEEDSCIPSRYHGCIMRNDFYVANCFSSGFYGSQIKIEDVVRVLNRELPNGKPRSHKKKVRE